jgi:hypothetical protein
MHNFPIVYAWREDEISAIQHRADWSIQIDCDSINNVIEWAEKFSGNHRLANDVSLPLERCVIAAYQIGYLFDYVEAIENNADKFFTGEGLARFMSEGLASVLLHTIASYEMTGRWSQKLQILFNGKPTWSKLCDNIKHMTGSPKNNLLELSESMFKYQRWLLYNHMGRTKRWDEAEFNRQYIRIIMSCCRLANNFQVSLEKGFALTMSKIQDGEIKRH